MCGIIGTNIDASLVERGLASMQRGNDGTKIISVDDISLGFKRHQIVGGNSGLQPFSNGQQALVFNGELFDFKRLAQSFGIKLTPDLSDSEVLFHVLCKEGIDILGELNIMADGAFLCLEQENLILFRDWVGEMPLHYVIPEPRRWIFASTCRALTQVTGLPADTIKEVPPGGRVYLPLSGSSIRVEYPEKPSDAALEIKNDEAALLVRQALEDAAKSRYWPHAPSAVMVSGGIDSTCTLLLTLQRWRHQHRLPIYTFHCSGEPVTEDTDLYHALQVAKHFDGLVDHRIVLVSADNIIAAVDETIDALEDKRGRDFNIITALYNRFIAQGMAKDGIKVAYEGEGADEALASYDPWGSYTVNAQISGDVGFRQKMVGNLHKGVLMRTSKVMMHFGPVECRSYFLDQKVNDLLSHLPTEVVRFNGHRKGILAQAFSDILPEFLLQRPKARPQDASGISQIIRDNFGNLDVLAPTLHNHPAEFIGQ